MLKSENDLHDVDNTVYRLAMFHIDFDLWKKYSATLFDK